MAAEQDAREKLKALIDQMPADANSGEILHKLVLNEMARRGIADADAGRVHSLADARAIVTSWAE